MLGAIGYLRLGGRLGLPARRCCSPNVLRLVLDRHRREPARRLQPAGGPLVPHGDDVVHLLRGDVLRASSARCSMRACCRCRGSAARCQGVSNFILWPQFEAVWPTNAGARRRPRRLYFGTIPAIGVPALNTAILLTTTQVTSPTRAARPAGAAGWRCSWADVLLGFTFVGLQAASTARPTELGLRLSIRHLRLDFSCSRLSRPARTLGAIHAHRSWLRVLRGTHRQPALRVRGGRLVLHFVDWVWLALYTSSTGCSERSARRQAPEATGGDFYGCGGALPDCRVGRDQPEVPGQHQQRKQHQRHVMRMVRRAPSCANRRTPRDR